MSSLSTFTPCKHLKTPSKCITTVVSQVSPSASSRPITQCKPRVIISDFKFEDDVATEPTSSYEDDVVLNNVLKRKATAFAFATFVKSPATNKKFKPSRSKNVEELYDELFGSHSSNLGFSPSSKFPSSSQISRSFDEPIDDLFAEFQHVPAPYRERSYHAPPDVDPFPKSAPSQTTTTQEPLLSTPVSSHHINVPGTTTHVPQSCFVLVPSGNLPHKMYRASSSNRK
uniref:Uncharacterized protein n=1 Tax=Cucumis melo TaxID=3656 RepID=A0A9I9DKK1_CUCME